MIHIYTETMQPATNFIDRCGEVEFSGGFDPEKRIYTHCCGEKSPAKDCVVQCYYDGLRCWCAPGKGCKDPKVIEEKIAKEFRNRSAGQKARWAKVPNV